MNINIKPGSAILKTIDGTTQYYENIPAFTFGYAGEPLGKVEKIIDTNASIEIKVKMTKRQMQRFLYMINGIPTTNNYLKHHGGIMRRKGRNKRK